jgi:diacylglycerol kinase family enzyme
VHGDVNDIVAGLDSNARRTLDIPTVRAPWGDAKFVESAGVGAFAAMLRDAEREEANGVASSRPNPEDRGAQLRRVLAHTRPHHWYVDADGDDLSGDYVLAMLLNTGYVGPRLALAPDADAGDGQLDLLLVREADRQALGMYLDALAGSDAPTLPVPTRRVTRVRLGWQAAHGHVDDHLWPEPAGPGKVDRTAGGIVEIDAAGSSLRILVPRITGVADTTPRKSPP